jgi:hypothetical protein
VNEAELRKNGTLVQIFEGKGYKTRVFEINNPQLFLDLLIAIRKDLYAQKPIGTNGLGGGGLTTRTAEAYAPPARLFVTEGGTAVGVVSGDMIKSVGATPYSKGNFSSLFRALRQSGGTVLDAHFGDATPDIYTYFGMHPGAINNQDIREQRPDWNPVHALQEFPQGTKLYDPSGRRVELKTDDNGIGIIPQDALDGNGAIRADWRVVNPKVFMYAKEGPIYKDGFTEDALKKINIAEVDNLDEGYSKVRAQFATHRDSMNRQRAAAAELTAA